MFPRPHDHRIKSPKMDNKFEIVSMLILPILSDRYPAIKRPVTLNKASMETAKLAAVEASPTRLDAIEDAWEIIIMPEKAPQSKRNNII